MHIAKLTRSGLDCTRRHQRPIRVRGSRDVLRAALAAAFLARSASSRSSGVTMRYDVLGALVMLTGGMRDPLSSAVIGSLGAFVEDFVDGDFADVGFAGDAAGADAADFVAVFAATFAADFDAGFAADFAADFVSVFVVVFAADVDFAALFAAVFATDAVFVTVSAGATVADAPASADFADASARS